MKNETEYPIQHNGRGKYHFIIEGNILCNAHGSFNFTKSETVVIKNKIFYEKYNPFDVFVGGESRIYEPDYCKKCLNIALKNEKRKSN